MSLRGFVGGLAAYFYNDWVGKAPSRSVRYGFLRHWLGSLGAGAGVQRNCQFYNGRKVFIGERSVINLGCVLDGRKHPVRIGSDVSMGPAATILTLAHDLQSPSFDDKGGEVVIGDRVFIGYGAIILPGVTIGEGAAVAAGSVVTRNVAAFTVVGGTPAKYIKDRPRNLAYRLDYHPRF